MANGDPTWRWRIAPGRYMRGSQRMQRAAPGAMWRRVVTVSPPVAQRIAPAPAGAEVPPPQGRASDMAWHRRDHRLLECLRALTRFAGHDARSRWPHCRLHRAAPAARRRQHATDAERALLQIPAPARWRRRPPGSEALTVRRAPKTPAALRASHSAAGRAEKTAHLSGHRSADVLHAGAGKSQRRRPHRHAGWNRNAHLGGHHRRRGGAAVPPLRRQLGRSRWSPWRCSTAPPRPIPACCAMPTATCSRIPRPWRAICVEKLGAEVISVRLLPRASRQRRHARRKRPATW